MMTAMARTAQDPASCHSPDLKMLQKLLQRRQSDTDFIDNTRRMVEFWDRYRVYITIGGLAIIFWTFWYLTATWNTVANCDENELFSIVKLNKTWLLISLIFGITIGLHFAGLMSYLVKSILGGYRAERLLLRLHAELERQSEDTSGE